ncbi:MAG: hypothetical protein ABW221_01760 [Vicinamibacteria bacterium]
MRLLEGVVDYAGLFPPAALDLPAAAAEYERHRRGGDAWMLGRFVLPASRLVDLSAVDGWRLSALLGPDVAADAAAVDAFNARHGGRALVDAVELKAASPQEVAPALSAAPRGVTAYVEVPLDDTLDASLDAIQAHGGRAKARTGGVTAAAFPPPGAVVRFLEGCLQRALSFKATAGLHHPVRAEQALTYAADAPRGVMHGFLNLLAAIALLGEGAPRATAQTALEELDPAAFAIEDGALAWRGRRLDAGAVRARFAGFGSCSFAEPVADLRALGLLA